MRKIGSRPLWTYSRRVYNKQRNLRWNHLSPQGCSEKEIAGNICTNQLVFICKTVHLHSGQWWSESTLPSTVWDFWASAIFHGLVNARFCHVSATKSVLMGQRFESARKSLQKRWKLWEKYWKMVSRHASKSCTNDGKSESLRKGTGLKDMLYK
jgi:hypothetical protein